MIDTDEENSSSEEEFMISPISINNVSKGCFPVMCFFTYVYVRVLNTRQYASMNEFTCSEHSVRIHT